MLKILFYNKFIICLYMFCALCAHHQEVKIVLYSIWYHHTVHGTATYKCDDTRCCIIQFCALSWLITKIILKCTAAKH